MIAVLPFDRAHLDALALQPAQAPELAALQGSIAAQADRGPAFTVMEGGRVLLCAGLAENHARYATAWALFAAAKAAAMVATTRAIARVIAASGYERIDMLVREDFARAHDFARLLGFDREGSLRRYGADGGDFALYARIAAAQEGAG
jgi:hypothetical protein